MSTANNIRNSLYSYRGAEEANPSDVLPFDELKLLPQGTPLWREMIDNTSIETLMNGGERTQIPGAPYFYIETKEHSHCRFIKSIDRTWEVRGRSDGIKWYNAAPNTPNLSLIHI